MNTNFYVPFFKFYYILYIMLTICLQFLLLALIKTKSPASLNQLKCYLYNTTVVQLLLAFFTFFLQHRLLPNRKSLAILSYGPCQLFGPLTCFTTYHIFNSISLNAAVGIANTVLFRYVVLVCNTVSFQQIFIMITVSYIPSIILLIIPFTAKWDFDSVRNETVAQHPSYDLSIYEPISGFYNVENTQFLIATAILAIGVYGVVGVCMVLTRRILLLINFNQNMSDRTKKQAKTLMHGLMVQTLLPMICYIPTFTNYIYTQITGDGFMIIEHIILLGTSLPALVDPLIAIYFIIPYRLAIFHLICKKQKTAQQIFTVSISANTR